MLDEVAVQKRLWTIKEYTLTDDDDKAHEEEDSLHYDFIKHVAENAGDPELRRLAVAVLSSRDIAFYRWIHLPNGGKNGSKRSL